MTLGTCPVDDKHQITQISASREGYLEYCCKCRKWRTKIDLRPIRAELREMGVDPDAKSPYASVSLKGTWEC